MAATKTNKEKFNLLSTIVSYVITVLYWIIMGFYKIFIRNLKYPIIGIIYYIRQIVVIIIYSLKGLILMLKTIYKGLIYPIVKFIKKTYTISKKKSKIRRENSASTKRKQEQLEQERKALISALEKGEERSETAVIYRYKALNPSTGKIEISTMTGTSRQDVMSYLVNEGFTVYSIETSKQINFFYGNSLFSSSKMRNKDLIFWLTQLSTYVKSGISLVESVRILGKQMGKNLSRKRLFNAISYELTMGNTFSDALLKQNNVFPSLLINMLKAAEATGDLEGTLDDMANYYTEVETTRKEMISAMTYPAIISVFALAVVTFIVIFIVPQFVGIYEQMGVELNVITQFIVNFSVFMQKNIIYVAIFLIAIIVAIIMLYKNIKPVRYWMQYFLMHMPIVKKIIIFNEITIFTKTFASLLKNNVYITESMKILSKITNNEIYKNIIATTMTNIYRGDKISLAFKDHWAIPDVAYYMIVTGESTGELPSMMGKVSEYYQEEHKNIIAKLKAFIEPAMIIFLAATVGTVIIAVIIPMFKLYGEIS